MCVLVCVCVCVLVVRGHVSGEVVSLFEVLVADRAAEPFLPAPPEVSGARRLPLVVGAHVEHKVGGHAE